MVRPDPFAWMAETTPELLTHLAAERAFYDASTLHLSSLVAELRAEMRSRVPETSRSAHWSLGLCSYYTSHDSGKDYPRLIRYRSGDDATDFASHEVLLDQNELLTDSGYLELGLCLVSPDERTLAYSVDDTGEEVYELRFRDLATGQDLPDRGPRTYYSGAWSADSQWFLYTVPDEAYRPYQVWRHRLGTDVADDFLVLEQPDERFEIQVRLSRTGDVIVVWSDSNTTSECWVLDGHDVTAAPRSVGGRRDGVRYHAEHRRLPDGSSDLLVVTNDDAVEFRLCTTPVPEADQDHPAGRPARPERDDQRLERVDAFAAGVVLHVQTGGEHQLHVVPHEDLAADGLVVASRWPCGDVRLATSPTYDGPVTVLDQADLRPATWSTVDLTTGDRLEVHAEEAPGYDPDRYVTERHEFPAPDGTMVPATLLRHRDTALDGTAPALVYGYGAYEAVFEPEWDPALPSLLDRGVVWVKAHIRGGGELGRRWYLDGKLAHKQHTFDDQIAVADGLAAAGLVDGHRIATRGLSAGGLLQGAVFSQRPDRWRAVVAEVPFVDVVTTMFDEATPLTITEWEEWGDPRVREEFDWMLAYSPYDNLPPAGTRPDLLVTGAVHDPRVMVREPAKWVAALRLSDPEWSPHCLFRCETGAGAHVGPSGRFGHLDYEAEVAAWVLDRLGAAS